VERCFSGTWNPDSDRTLSVHRDVTRAEINGERGVFVDTEYSDTGCQGALKFAQLYLTNEAA
jgi:hypothetical protein